MRFHLKRYTDLFYNVLILYGVHLRVVSFIYFLVNSCERKGEEGERIHSSKWFCRRFTSCQVDVDGSLLCGSMPIDYFYLIGRQERSLSSCKVKYSYIIPFKYSKKGVKVAYRFIRPMRLQLLSRKFLLVLQSNISKSVILLLKTRDDFKNRSDDFFKEFNMCDDNESCVIRQKPFNINVQM